jgi:hypothetical protein
MGPVASIWFSCSQVLLDREIAALLAVADVVRCARREAAAVGRVVAGHEVVALAGKYDVAAEIADQGVAVVAAPDDVVGRAAKELIIAFVTVDEVLSIWPVAKSLPAPARMWSRPPSPASPSSPSPPISVSLPPGRFRAGKPSRKVSPVSPRTKSFPAPASMRSSP